jgi:hypothetical protein
MPHVWIVYNELSAANCLVDSTWSTEDKADDRVQVLRDEWLTREDADHCYDVERGIYWVRHDVDFDYTREGEDESV